MSEIRKSAGVNASPEQVFALLTDLDRLPEWSTVTVATQDAPSGELRQGDTFRQTLRVVGKQIDAEWTVTELDRPRHIAYEAKGPAGAWLRMAQTVQPSGGGSRVSVEIDYELPGGAIGGAVSSLMERRNEREVEHSLHNLADLAES